MLRIVLSLLAVGLLAYGPTPARAEEAPAPGRALTLASDAEAAEALAVFKEDWKAQGLKGDEKVMQRDFAMRKIAGIQHPDVIAELGKASRNGDADVRMLALIYLGDQKALAHLAAEHVMKAMQRNKKDLALVLTGLQTLGELKYLGARKVIGDLIGDRNFVVRKAAIACVGRIGDKRMLEEVLGALGLKLEDGGKEPDKKEGGKEVVEEGYSWEGAEAVVDRGEADNSKENADAKAQAEAQIARNKAAAAAAAGGRGGGASGPSMGGSGGRGGSSRSTEELIPTILRTLKALTGEEFDKPSSIRKWMRTHAEQLQADKKALDEQEKAQKDAAK